MSEAPEQNDEASVGKDAVEVDPFEAARLRARHRRRWLVALSLLVAVIVSIRPILMSIGAYLVVDEAPLTDGTHVLLLDAPSGWMLAANACEQDPTRRVLVIPKRPGRAMQLGALPTYEVFVRDKLVERGVDPEAIDILAGSATDASSHVRALAGWLREHPDARVVALTAGLSGRSWRRALDEGLPEADRHRVMLHAAQQAGVDPIRWWQSKAGTIAVLKQYVALAYGGQGAAP